MDTSTLLMRVVLHSLANEILESFANDNILVEDGLIDKNTLLLRVVLEIIG